jgi:hypothetical protein
MLAGPSDIHVKEQHTARESKRELIRGKFSGHGEKLRNLRRARSLEI